MNDVELSVVGRDELLVAITKEDKDCNEAYACWLSRDRLWFALEYSIMSVDDVLRELTCYVEGYMGCKWLNNELYCDAESYKKIWRKSQRRRDYYIGVFLRRFG